MQHKRIKSMKIEKKIVDIESELSEFQRELRDAQEAQKSEIEVLKDTVSRNSNANIPTQNKGTNELEKSAKTGCEKSLVN